MPLCKKCHPTFDLGRICPHEGLGREVWEQGRAAGRAEVAVVLQDLIAVLRSAEGEWGAPPTWVSDPVDRAEARLREVQGE
jgi:hypothetical protein